MKIRDLLGHAASGAWMARRRADVWAAAGVLGAIACACVIAAGIGRGIDDAVQRELTRSRPELGTIVVQPVHANTGGPALRQAHDVLDRIRHDPASGVEEVSAVYRNPVHGAVRLRVLGPDGAPYPRETRSISVVSHDPLVRRGFGLPAEAGEPFLHGGSGSCWRMAFVVSREGLRALAGVSEERIERMVAGDEELPVMRFESSVKFRDLEGVTQRLPAFGVQPEGVLNREGHSVPMMIFHVDSVLAIHHLGNEWSARAFTRVQAGMKDDCVGSEGDDPATPLSDWTWSRHPSDPDVLIVNRANAESIRVAANARGIHELLPRESANLRTIPIQHLLVWVRNFANQHAFDDALKRVRSTLAEKVDGIDELRIDLSEPELLGSQLNLRSLARSRERLTLAVGALLAFIVTVAFGVAHVYRARREIGLLRSQGASRGIVLGNHAVETVLVAGAGSLAGAIAGMGVVASGATSLLVRWIGDVDAGVVAATSMDLPVGAAIGTVAILVACTCVGGVIVGLAGASVDPARQLRPGD